MAENFNSVTDFLENYRAYNNWQTTLQTSIDESVTVIKLSSISGLPPKGYVSIDQEHIFYESINTLTNELTGCQRGVDNSIAASHSAGTIVQHRILAAAFNNMILALPKRRRKTITANQVTAASVSEQNIVGFAGRAWVSDIRIAASGGSTNFSVELFERDSFRTIDMAFSKSGLSSVETTLSANANANDTIINVSNDPGFSTDQIVVIGDITGTYEEAKIKNINATSIELYDALNGSWSAGATVLGTYQFKEPFVLEDKDYLEDDQVTTKELHVRIINNDVLYPVITYFIIIGDMTEDE
jgi:hypothetical protein